MPVWKEDPHTAGTCSVAMHDRPEDRILKGDRVGGPCNGVKSQ